ncbi:hypothetical protein CL621_02670 [archaeon]|nr:hypothetical protein [archaeon]
MKSLIIGAEPYFKEFLKKEGIPFEDLNLNRRYDIVLAISLKKNILKENGLLIYLDQKLELKKTQKAVKIQPFKKLVLPNKNNFYSLNKISLNKKIPSKDEYARRVTNLIITHCKKNKLLFLRIWYFPRSKFIFSISHDTDFAKDIQAQKTLNLEKKFNIKSTFFIHKYSLSKKFLKYLRQNDFHVNSHIDLNRSMLSIININLTPIGLIPLRILRFLNTRFKITYPDFLEKFIQKLVLLEKINNGNRNHGLIWCNNFEKILVDSGIRWDSSFGSSKVVGFPFETGLPFKIKSLLEIPFLFQDVGIIKIKDNQNYEKFIEQTIKSEYYCNFNIVSHLLHPRSNKILENFLKLMLKYKIPHIPLDRFVEWWVKREELEITNINYDNKKIEFEINNPKLPVTILVLTKDKKNSWKIKDNYFTPIQELKHKTKCKLKN